MESAFSIGVSQNLVPDGDFENNITCPDTIVEINPPDIVDLHSDYWYSPTFGSSDLFNSCSPDPINQVPANMIGYQYSFSGQGYAGLILVSYPGLSNYREYLQSRLVQSLEVGKKYDVSFYVSRSDTTVLATDDIAAAFSVNAVVDFTMSFGFGYTDSLDLTPQIENTEGNVITDSSTWTRISGSFIADQPYGFITIGNFKSYSSSTIVYRGTHPVFNFAYYYVDSILVTESEIPSPPPPTPLPPLDKTVLPTLFTPNTDGYNDTFAPHIADATEFRIEIFNRWGDCVFISSHENIQWRGKTEGVPVSDGIYYWSILYRTSSGQQHLKGWVQLMR